MRQYTTAYIEIPQKQGKRELGAAIALNMLANPMKGASGWLCPKPLLRKGLGIFISLYYPIPTPIEFRKALQTLDQAPLIPLSPSARTRGDGKRAGNSRYSHALSVQTL